MILYILEMFCAGYFIYVVAYALFFSLASLRKNKSDFPTASRQAFLGVFIPAYKEDEIIVATARSALKQNYDNYEVVIIADSLQKKTIDALRQLPVTVVEVTFEKSTKAKALNKAFTSLERNYEIAVILDADNIMEQGVLQKINNAFQSGKHAIQTQRVAKNSNNSMAVQDGISEAINNRIYRRGFQNVGLSTPIIGSGMAYEYKLLKQTLRDIDAVGGFDRELQLQIIEQGVRIFYLEDARVFDEKVDKSSVFGNQRRRWIASQVFYVKKFFLNAFKSLLKGNFDYFNMAVLANIQLPRLINLGTLGLLVVGTFMLRYWLTISPLFWTVLLLAYVVAFLIALPRRYYNRQLFTAILHLPRTFWLMILSLLKIKGANQQFIHTPHSNKHNEAFSS